MAVVSSASSRNERLWPLAGGRWHVAFLADGTCWHSSKKSRMQQRYSLFLLLKKKTFSFLFVLLVCCCYWQSLQQQQSIQNATLSSSQLLLLKSATIRQESHDASFFMTTGSISSSSTRSPKEQILEETTTTTRRSRQFVKFNKRGRKVMKEITSVSISDLKDLTNDDTALLPTISSSSNSTATDNNNNKTTNRTVAMQGKEKVVALLRRAGILKMDVETIARLPTWKAISDLYYNGNQEHHKPVIVHGFDDSCRDFQNHVPRHDAYLAPAGLFNSGTNALTYYLRANLVMVHNTVDPSHFNGILTQVPWHKHWLSRLRYNHTIPRHEHFNKDHVLPIVIIRDPLSWAQSMCQHPYDVKWMLLSPPQHHTHTTKQQQQRYCPNFVTTHNDGKKKLGVPVQIPAMMTNNENNITWPSLLHLWKDWYHDYLESSKPFLMIRHEDLLFHPEEVIAAIQDCAGASRLNSDNSSSSANSSVVFTYVMDAAKWEHQKVYGPQSNRISAMIKHGNAARRIRNLTRADLEYAKAVLLDNDDDSAAAAAAAENDKEKNEQQEQQSQQHSNRRRPNLLRLFQYTLPDPTSTFDMP